MKLYSGPLSLFTAKVRIALAEKEIPYERIEVPFSRERAYEPKHAEVVARNPKGQVPVLVDGDLSLYDSTVIIEYLEDRKPDPPLFPKDPAGRARCRQLELHSDEVLFPEVWRLITQVFYKPDPADRDAAEVSAASAAISRIYGELDRQLEGRTWFCDTFSAADIAYVLTILFASQLGVPPPPSLPHLSAWLTRTTERPAVAREIQEMMSAGGALPA